MSPTSAITTENLGKRYLLTGHSSTDLREQIALTTRRLLSKHHTSRRAPKPEHFWAIRDISTEIKRGELVGIIGKNGAGKSTLLKVLARITAPTEGRFTLRGRLATLLEVGTGFHPELSGEENIYLNGAILGMSRSDIKQQFDAIVAFSGVERFLYTPVKRYSSGMYLRLAFAVAAHLQSDILIADEVLAVGDIEFQKRCLAKLSQVSTSGRTVLFVSHNMAAVRQLTSRVLLLKEGRIIADGPTKTVVSQYADECSDLANTVFNVKDAPRTFRGTAQATILCLWFDRQSPFFEADEDFEFRLRLHANDTLPTLRVSMTIFSSAGEPVGSAFGPHFESIEKGADFEVTVVLSSPRLAPGRYFCGVSVGRGNNRVGHADYDVVLETLQFEVAPEQGDMNTASSWAAGWGHIRFQPLLCSSDSARIGAHCV